MSQERDNATEREQGEVLLGYLIKQVQLAFNREMSLVLDAHQLTITGYAALFHLNHGQEGMSNAQIARASWVTPQTMHRVTTSLQSDGLIVMDSTQGRAIRFVLTDTGRARLVAATRDVEALESQMARGLSCDEVSRLSGLLQTCLENLDALAQS